MPVNDFEKQVQQKMDELQLRPSAEVWEEVEKRIRKEKKRRIIFWLPLLLLLVAGGAGIYFLAIDKKNNNNEEKITADSSGFNKEKSTAAVVTEKQKEIAEKKEDKVNNSLKPGKTDGGDINNTVPYDNSFFKKVKESKKINTALPKERTPYISSVTNKRKQQIKKSDKPAPVLLAEQQPGIVTNNNLTVISEVPDKDISAIPSPAANQPPGNKNLIDTNSKTENSNPSIDNEKGDSITNTNTTAVQQKAKKKDSWKWGASFSIGKSSLAEGFTVLNKAFSSDVFNQSLPGSGGGTITSVNSSSVRKGTSFKAGAFIQKPISKKLDLKISADYSFLSWKFNVGTRVDSIIRLGTVIVPPGSTNILPVGFVNGYYRSESSSSTAKYKNSYHFLGLSAELSWKIIPGKKLSLYWDNGLGFNRLLGSNMLHYSSVLPGYYKNNSLLAKNHLFFLTGLSFKIDNRFYIGTSVNYSLTTVLKNETGVKKHFSNIGLNARFLFRK
jgi:hypothetical protein